MRRYRWSGIGEDGKSQTGETLSQSKEAVEKRMVLRGYSSCKVVFLGWVWHTSGSLEALAGFTQQLETLLLAGLSLVAALRVLQAEGRDDRQRWLVGELVDCLQAGLSFSDALRQRSDMFTGFYCAMVEAGENSAQLGLVLGQLLTHYQAEITYRDQLRKVLFYPTCVLACILILSACLLGYVVPQFEQLYREAQVPLPRLTQQLLCASRMLRRQGGWIVGGVISSILLFRRLTSQRRGWHEFFSRGIGYLPVLGEMRRQRATALFARAMALSQAAQQEMVPSLLQAAEIVGDYCYQQRIFKVAAYIEGGSLLSEALGRSPGFPSLLRQLVSVGEHSGRLPDMLTKAAAHYDQALRKSLERSLQSLEPLLLLGAGLLVGCMLLVLYLPLLYFGDVLGS